MNINISSKLHKVKTNELFRKSSLNFFLQIIGLALSYFVVFFITKKYDASTLGYYTLANVLLQLFSMIALSGMNTATVQIVPNLFNKNESKGISSIFIKGIAHTFIAGLACTLVLYYSANFIAYHIMHKPELIIPYQTISYAIIPASILTFISDFLRGCGMSLWWAIINKILVFLIFSVLIIFNTADPTFLFMVSYFLAVIPTIVILIYQNKKNNVQINLKNWSGQPAYSEVRKLAFPMFLFSSTLLLGNWITTLMIGSLGTSSDTGIYRVIDRISALNVLVLTAVNAVLAPKIAGAFSSGNIPLMKQNVRSSTKIIFWASLPIQLFIVLFHNKILQIFGNEFTVGSYALLITVGGQIINSLAGPVGQVLNMTNSQVFLRNVSIIGLLLTVIIGWILIPYFGINGAAIAAFCNSLYLNVICVYKIRKKFAFNTLYNPFTKSN